VAFPGFVYYSYMNKVGPTDTSGQSDVRLVELLLISFHMNGINEVALRSV